MTALKIIFSILLLCPFVYICFLLFNKLVDVILKGNKYDDEDK